MTSPVRWNPFTNNLDYAGTDETAGNVVGPVSSVSGDIVIFSGATGKIIADSGKSIADISPLTTKGDLYGYDTKPTRIPIGIDGQSLVADSAEASGVSWKDPPTPFAWQVVTAASNPVHLVAGNSYIPKGASQVQFVLPVAAAIGDTFKILGYGNLWTIQQNASQSMTYGIATSSAGVLGSVTATQVRDSTEITCVTDNVDFQLSDVNGNLEFA